jgi:hypothetical protein
MRTDDDLTALLRRGFTQATEELDPAPDLVRIVRRRYVRARRRQLVVAATVPVAAIAVGSGLIVAGRDNPNRAPSHTAAAVPRTAPVTPAPAKPASYKLAAHKHSAAPNCPANATAPVGKSANPEGLWFWTKERTCVFVRVDWADTKPASAAPVHLEGYPGLYRTLDDEVRAIYAPVAPGTNDAHPAGGWVVLTASASVSEEKVVRLILVPANP